jgi:hypothetical protein
MRSSFLTDLLGFMSLDIMVTLLMMALLFALFGHLSIKGRWQVFDRIGGSLSGFFVGIIILSIAITLLRIPHEANRLKLDPNGGIPAVELFNQGYDHSVLAPIFMRGAPYLVASTNPLLPPDAHIKGAVPLLESVVLIKQ